MKRVQGKVVLLTGAGTDVVQACARALVKEGARVVLADRDEATAKKAAAEFDSRTAIAIGLNPGKEADWQKAIEAVVGGFGRIDAFVSGPAPVISRRIRDWSLADWQAFEDEHMLGPWLGTKYSIMELRKYNGGSVIILSSIYAKRAKADAPANAAAAAGLRVMVQAAALECGQKGDGIRVNSVLMDPAVTSANEDVAAAVVYLSSSESTFMTATDLAIDGGTLAA